jgi:hypothetical protein
MSLDMTNVKTIVIDPKDAVSLISRGILKRSNFVRNNASDGIVLEDIPMAYAKRINHTAKISIDGITVGISSPTTVENIYAGTLDTTPPKAVAPVVEEVVEPIPVVEEPVVEEVEEVLVQETVVEEEGIEEPEVIEESPVEVEEEIVETLEEEESTIIEESSEVEGNYTEYITEEIKSEDTTNNFHHKKKKRR